MGMIQCHKKSIFWDDIALFLEAIISKWTLAQQMPREILLRGKACPCLRAANTAHLHGLIMGQPMKECSSEVTIKALPVATPATV
jgi:hypothetical protein